MTARATGNRRGKTEGKRKPKLAPDADTSLATAGTQTIATLAPIRPTSPPKHPPPSKNKYPASQAMRSIARGIDEAMGTISRVIVLGALVGLFISPVVALLAWYFGWWTGFIALCVWLVIHYKAIGCALLSVAFLPPMVKFLHHVRVLRWYGWRASVGDKGRTARNSKSKRKETTR